jgi:hypothetical protein
MKKAGLIAASIGTAAVLAAGAAGMAHLAMHPGDAIEEANAAEVRPAARAQRQSGGDSSTGQGLLGWFAGGGERVRATSGPETQRAAAVGVTDDDDDDDDDD